MKSMLILVSLGLVATSASALECVGRNERAGDTSLNTASSSGGQLRHFEISEPIEALSCAVGRQEIPGTSFTQLASCTKTFDDDSRVDVLVFDTNIEFLGYYLAVTVSPKDKPASDLTMVPVLCTE